MEVKSEPKYNTVQVTDLDIAFPGDLQTYTIKPEDSLDTVHPNLLVLTFGTGGAVVFNLTQAHWYAKRHRTIRVLAPDPDRA